MARRGNANDMVIISWRDIPAQVNGGSADNRQQQILPQRFHGAIDRAAMKAGKKTSGEYVAEWRRTTVPIAAEFEGDIAAAVLAEAARLEAEFPAERLKQWIDTGGWNPDRPEHERT